MGEIVDAFSHAQPWMLVLAIVVLLVVGLGMRWLVRSDLRHKSTFDWKRDPEEMGHLSLHLRRARIQMAMAVLALLVLTVIGIMSWLQGE